jgi:hypothetical protein
MAPRGPASPRASARGAALGKELGAKVIGTPARRRRSTR